MNNIAGDFPEKVEEMREKLKNWRKDVGAQSMEVRN